MVATIIGGLASTESRRERKLAARRVLSVTMEDDTANPSYCPWSEVPITFNRADQWADIPYIGCFPLVLDATIQKVPADKTETECLIRRSKHYVLVDGNMMRKVPRKGYYRNASPNKRE